jgi:hypothetical protein
MQHEASNHNTFQTCSQGLHFYNNLYHSQQMALTIWCQQITVLTICKKKKKILLIWIYYVNSLMEFAAWSELLIQLYISLVHCVVLTFWKLMIILTTLTTVIWGTWIANSIYWDVLWHSDAINNTDSVLSFITT